MFDEDGDPYHLVVDEIEGRLYMGWQSTRHPHVPPHLDLLRRLERWRRFMLARGVLLVRLVRRNKCTE